MGIYFKSRKKPKNMSGIKELLRSGYTGRNDGTFKQTFEDEACTIPECHPARRSFGDLLAICKTHFPKTTEKELAKVVFELNKEIGLGGSYCNTIEKPVFFVRGVKDERSFIFGREYDRKKGVSKYSFNSIKNLVNKE